MTLALLLTAVTGAWASGDTKYNVTFKANGNTKTVENITLPHTFGCNIDNETERGTGELDVIIQELYGLNGGHCASMVPESDNASVYSDMDDGDFQYIIVNAPFDGTATVTGKYYVSGFIDYSLEITCVDPNAEPADDAIDVTPVAGKTNEWTFTMPAFDVEIAPIYAPVAQWAKVEDVDQLPTAIEGIYAESTDAIVKAGTVAKIDETENPQGIVMYAVTSTNQATAPELSAFSATLPTAKDITAAGDVYVWYYIKGADTPQGQTATAENTFNDSEICAEPLTVTVLNNKFNIQFTAANANTIEAGKATVTVGGAATTVTEGKLEGVKMGSEVKVTAKEGYKFRKVEVKKGGGAKPLANATTEDLGKVIGADGNIYANKDAAEAANTTAVAMICYVVEGHGLALALTDEVDKMNWSTAQTTCDAHTPAITGGKWMLASKGEWNNMISAAGSYSALRDGFSSVGGTNMQSEGYWSSTEDDSSDAWNYYFSNGLWSDVSKNWNRCVRACLAF